MRISDWSSDVCSSDLGMGAEDFAYFVQPELGVPGAYFAVGGTPQADIDAAKNGGPPVPSHHSPFFKIEPEPSVRLGTEEMTVAVPDLLDPAAASAAAPQLAPGVHQMKKDRKSGVWGK